MNAESKPEPKNYLCVFLEVNGEDIGRDPDFSTPPTWGICRPDVRSWVEEGSYLVFIGCKKDENGNRRYFLKSLFQVGVVLTYIEALKKYPSRRNVIIRRSPVQPASVAIDERRWKYSSLKKLARAKENLIPSCLMSIRCENEIFIQNPDDDHEIDN